MFNPSQYRKTFIFRAIAPIIIAAFLGNTVILPTTARAQSVLDLPPPGTMILTSASYTPAIVAGINLHPDNPLQIDFIIDSGDDHLAGEALKKEAEKLISYFMATLTVPEDEMWVNLSPYEKDRIIADGLGNTVLGRDMLAQDYVLKQLTASMMHPEEDLGNQFWTKLYAQAREKFGTTEIPTNTFNKIWIIPEEAVIYVNGTNVFVSDSRLKVMLEEDYLSLEHHDQGLDGYAEANSLTEETKRILREIFIPEIEREVNEGKNFAKLRQIYHSMILATWYKKNLKDSLLGKVYVNQNKINGVDVEDRDTKHKIYNQYVEAFKRGVFDYIREDYDTVTKEVIPRKYFSGGLAYTNLSVSSAVSSGDTLNRLSTNGNKDYAVLAKAQLGRSASPVAVDETISAGSPMTDSQYFNKAFSDQKREIFDFLEVDAGLIKAYSQTRAPNHIGIFSHTVRLKNERTISFHSKKNFSEKELALARKAYEIGVGTKVAKINGSLFSMNPDGEDFEHYDIRNVDQLERIVSALGKALGILHKEGILHLDHKRQHVFVEEKDGDFEIKFIDWDIAERLNSENKAYAHGEAETYRGILIHRYFRSDEFKPLISRMKSVTNKRLDRIAKYFEKGESLSIRMKNAFYKQYNAFRDAMNTAELTKGGIDLNPANLDLQTQGQATDINFTNIPNIQPSSVNGVTPVIINVTPITNFPLLIGLSEGDEQQLSLANDF